MKIYTLSGYNLSGAMRYHDSRRVAAKKVEVEVKAKEPKIVPRLCGKAVDRQVEDKAKAKAKGSRQ